MVCPICTVAVGAGVGFSRTLGIDDLIVGLWYGALIVSSIYWIFSIFDKKKIYFKYRNFLLFVITYLIFIILLFFTDILGNPQNYLFGIDKFLIGTILGSIIFYISVLYDRYLRKINKNKVLFYYQKVIIPIMFLIFGSLYIHYLLKIFM